MSRYYQVIERIVTASSASPDHQISLLLANINPDMTLDFYDAEIGSPSRHIEEQILGIMRPDSQLDIGDGYAVDPRLLEISPRETEKPQMLTESPNAIDSNAWMWIIEPAVEGQEVWPRDPQY